MFTGIVWPLCRLSLLPLALLYCTKATSCLSRQIRGVVFGKEEEMKDAKITHKCATIGTILLCY